LSAAVRPSDCFCRGRLPSCTAVLIHPFSVVLHAHPPREVVQTCSFHAPTPWRASLISSFSCVRFKGRLRTPANTKVGLSLHFRAGAAGAAQRASRIFHDPFPRGRPPLTGFRTTLAVFSLPALIFKLAAPLVPRLGDDDLVWFQTSH